MEHEQPSPTQAELDAMKRNAGKPVEDVAPEIAEADPSGAEDPAPPAAVIEPPPDERNAIAEASEEKSADPAEARTYRTRKLKAD